MDLINLGFGIIIGTIIGSLGILLFQKIKKDQIENKQDSDVFGEIKSLKDEVEQYNTDANKDRGSINQILTDMRTAEQQVGDAAKEIKMAKPVVVRLEGTNIELGRKILKESGLPFINAENFGETAKKIVEAVNKEKK